AEDGIRDRNVTGVQTCALPIYTLVDMGEYGQNKLNAAHALGGAALAVQTVSDLAGVPISHYAEINFDGFKDVVDALGGVEVDVQIGRASRRGRGGGAGGGGGRV